METGWMVMGKKYVSWKIIILFFVIFFPICILLLVKKMVDEKQNYIKNGKVLKIFGIIFFILGISFIIFEIFRKAPLKNSLNSIGFFLIMVILLCGAGIFMIKKGHEYIVLGKKVNRYLAIINTGNDTSIDKIATAYPTIYEKAITDIQELLDLGYFPDSYIDFEGRKLMMPVIKVPQPKQERQNLKYGTLKCRGCGAINTVIEGGLNYCKYCGNPL